MDLGFQIQQSFLGISAPEKKLFPGKEELLFSKVRGPRNLEMESNFSESKNKYASEGFLNFVEDEQNPRQKAHNSNVADFGCQKDKNIFTKFAFLRFFRSIFDIRFGFRFCFEHNP